MWVRLIHRCGLHTDFKNIFIHFWGVRLIHRCGLYTGNYGSPGAPVHGSSPRPTRPTHLKWVPTEMRSLIINFQSIKNKVPQFINLCD